MRRIALIAATALTALACALLPSGALAHGHHHHRGHHYARRARHHGWRFNRGHYGAGAGSGSQQTGSSGSSGAQGTETVGPSSGTQQGNAGKIVSFTEGVLTIELGEGEKATKVSGKVTEETEIHCIPAPTSTSTPPSSGTTSPSSSDDGWSGGWGQGQQGQQGQQGKSGWGHGGQGAWDDGEGGRNQEGNERCQCSTANLTPGTIVHRAVLLLTESGAVFREIELIH